ncbi:hypothetical protein CDAR_10821 [Caerostris darwini]|uniref:Uncharacterized protein n=1 Tax=Caerostris darwini TaxID=1538125 RepID=A0AAV4WDF5_9ARAC|nr:hypothetical protein CDAR_10821 [Caerostris darwini]
MWSSYKTHGILYEKGVHWYEKKNTKCETQANQVRILKKNYDNTDKKKADLTLRNLVSLAYDSEHPAVAVDDDAEGPAVEHEQAEQVVADLLVLGLERVEAHALLEIRLHRVTLHMEDEHLER